MRHGTDPRQGCFDFAAAHGGVATMTRGRDPLDRARDRGPATGLGTLRRDRKSSGAMAHWGGLAAESQVERHFLDRGLSLAARRWRGQSGEIDLVFRDGADIVFVEVKRGPTHDRAIERLSRKQIARLFAAGEEFLGQEPAGSLTPTRFDVALVDGAGRISVIANAFL